MRFGPNQGFRKPLAASLLKKSNLRVVTSLQMRSERCSVLGAPENSRNMTLDPSTYGMVSNVYIPGAMLRATGGLVICHPAAADCTALHHGGSDSQ